MPEEIYYTDVPNATRYNYKNPITGVVIPDTASTAISEACSLGKLTVTRNGNVVVTPVSYILNTESDEEIVLLKRP